MIVRSKKKLNYYEHLKGRNSNPPNPPAKALTLKGIENNITTSKYESKAPNPKRRTPRIHPSSA
jgi:hypothetical protein